MTIRLEITAEHPNEFYFKAVKILSILVRPPQTQPVEPPVTGGPVVEAEAESEKQEPTTEDAFPKSDDVGTDAPAVEQPKSRRGRPPKNKDPQPEQEVTENPPTETKQETDPSAAQPNEQQITDRIRGILDNEAAREYARRNATKGKDTAVDKSVMAHCTTYTMGLLQEFDAKKRSDIKPERYAEFMERSQAYLDGTVGEK